MIEHKEPAKNQLNFLDQKKILLLIEHEENRKILLNILAEDYEVEIAEAEKIPDGIFNLIIFDPQGLAMYKAILNREESSDEESELIFARVLIKENSIDSPGGKEFDLVDEIINIPTSIDYIKSKIKSIMEKNISRLSLSDKIYKNISKKSLIGVCILDESIIRYVNQSFLEIVGEEQSDILGKKFKSVFKSNNLNNLIEKKFENDWVSEILKVKLADEDKWLKVSKAKVKFLNKYFDLYIFLNLTGHLSYKDELTGLYTRNFLEAEIKRLDTNREVPLSLIMIDINGLKMVNDTFGHLVGDDLLEETANILRDSCRESDIIGRWGGDEFVIILPQTTKKSADDIYRRIIEESKKRKLPDTNLPISLAVGVATKKSSENNIFQVLSRAEDIMYDNKILESRRARKNILNILLKTIRTKSYETKGHEERLKAQSVRLSNKLSLLASELDKLLLLAALHDIGEIKIPEEVLKKTGGLSEKDWELIKKHPENGAYIVSSTQEFAHISMEILSHHEHWDGSGYPRGLKGEEIPIGARILSIIDAFDVMTKGRPYREPISKEEALKEIERCAGSQFDPELVREFIELF